VARALIVGCGCRGRALGERLLADGWAVRGTSRREEGLDAIREAGIEPAVADPLWPGTVLDLVGDVALVAWLLGSARAEGEHGEEEVAAIHGDRLERLLERLVETPVRGFVYEAGGSVDAAVLSAGRRAVETAAATWRIPVAAVAADTSDPDRWADEMAAAAIGLMG
jgi:nucleoside-diphosphate-sugar epimerase